MKLDHFVVNVDQKYQQDKTIIEHIRQLNLPYEPKWGKGTRGFKVSDLWIGNEYLEMVHLLKADGGGWIKAWCDKYNQGHRGLICLMLDVDDLDSLIQALEEDKLAVSKPVWLEFKWFFNLLTRRMPWRNSYLPFFDKVPMQIGFQEMKDDKSREFMNQYMVPNSRDHGINGIYQCVVRGDFTERDFELLMKVFKAKASRTADSVKIHLFMEQSIEFIKHQEYQVELYTDVDTGQILEIENIKIHC